jgi:hypothetical protein
MQSIGDKFCQLHNQIQSGGLQEHLTAKAGEIHDAGNKNVSNSGKVFGNAYAGAQMPFSQRDITHVFHHPKGSVCSNHKSARVI